MKFQVTFGMKGTKGGRILGTDYVNAPNQESARRIAKTMTARHEEVYSVVEVIEKKLAVDYKTIRTNNEETTKQTKNWRKPKIWRSSI